MQNSLKDIVPIVPISVIMVPISVIMSIPTSIWLTLHWPALYKVSLEYVPRAENVRK